MMINRRRLADLVHEVVSTPATIEELQSLAVVFQEVRFDSFELEQFAADIRESPYAWLLRMLPENKDQAYSFIQMLGTILAVVIAIIALHQKPQTPVGATPDQEKRIIEQLEDHIDEDSPGDCPSETPPATPRHKIKDPE